MENVQCNSAGKPSLLNLQKQESKLQIRFAHLHENFSIWSQQICMCDHTLILCSHAVLIYTLSTLHRSALLFQMSPYGMAVSSALQGIPGTTSPSLTLTNAHTVAATLPSCGRNSLSVSSCPPLLHPRASPIGISIFLEWQPMKNNTNCSSAILIIT